MAIYKVINEENETLNESGGAHQKLIKKRHDEVKNLKDEGLSAKEISKKLDIPLRSVYYILNKK